MSVLCVITAMMRPCLSRTARKCTTADSSPRSDVLAPPVDRQNRMFETCGTFFTSNIEWKIGSLSGTSSMT